MTAIDALLANNSKHSNQLDPVHLPVEPSWSVPKFYVDGVKSSRINGRWRCDPLSAESETKAIHRGDTAYVFDTCE